jgi:hypothetical protein
MLELLLKLIDLLTKAADEKEKDQQRYFDEFVRPTYAAAESIYRDYRSMLRELGCMVDRVDDPEPIIGFLDERREALKSARDGLRALVAKRISEGRGTRFETGVLGLMTGAMTAVEGPYLETLAYDEEDGYIRPQVGPHTVLDIVETLKDRRADFPSNRQLVRRAMNYKLAAVEEAWQDVVRGYADLHAATLPNTKVRGEQHLSRSEGIAKLRNLLVEVRAMPKSGRYDRKIGTEVERVSASAVPEVLWPARQVRGTVHDLDDHEPNVTAEDLETCADTLEGALDAIAARRAH